MTSHQFFSFSNIAVASSVNVVIAVSGALSGVMLARSLGPVGRGELAAIQLWPMLLATVAMVGMPEALVYFVARRAGSARAYLRVAVTVSLLASAALVLLGVVMLPSLLRSYSSQVVWTSQICLVIAPVYATFGISTHLFRALGRLSLWNLTRAAPAVAWLGISLAAALSWIPANAAPLAAMYAAVLVVIAVLTILLALSATVPAEEAGPPVRRELIAFAAPCFATTVPQTVTIRIDQVVVAGLLGPHALGFYVTATAWGALSQPILQGMSGLILPAVASIPPGTMQSDLLKKGWIVAGTTAGGLCVLGLLATPFAFPVVFGSQFAEGSGAAMILLLSGCLTGLNGFGGEALRGAGMAWRVMLCEYLGASVTVVAVTVLVTEGIEGVAIACALGAATTCGALVYATMKGASPSSAVTAAAHIN